MTIADDIREFLTTRRARLTPAAAGLPMFGRQRRVAGLRREEVALLAGISVEYYTRLERGNARGVSDEVLDAVCGALQLDEAASAPARPGADRERGATDEAVIGAREGPPEHPADRGLAVGDASVRPERPHGHPVRESPGPGPLLGALPDG